MIITTALANEIVARAMAIIHHNVNVIDHHGQIIASGERHRIGEQHGKTEYGKYLMELSYSYR